MLNNMKNIFKIMTNYRTVKVPEKLFLSIREYIEEHKELGYRTIAEFVIESTRRRFDEIKKTILEAF